MKKVLHILETILYLHSVKKDDLFCLITEQTPI